MKRVSIYILAILPLVISCSSGKNALERGDYFGAVERAVSRLRAKPSDEKAATILKDSYAYLQKWVQDEMDIRLSQGTIFKWEDVVALQIRVNQISNEIRRSPAALRIIPEPKTFTSELKMAEEKAAEARYEQGIKLIGANTRESAREALIHFERCNQLWPGYRDVKEKMVFARDHATIKVIIESIPVHSKTFQLTAGFFYDQVFEYMNDHFREKSFVRFFTLQEAEKMEIRYPDLVVRLEFFDFVVGDAVHHEVEQEVSRDVKIETKDTTKTEIKTYRAKLKTFTDKLISGGILYVRITDFQASRLLFSDKIPGEFVWQNQYGIYVGDIQALNDTQQAIVSRKLITPPPPQTLFMEFTRPIFGQLTEKMAKFFREYN